MLGVSQVNETPLSPADFTWARGHFIDYVRASGPLPRSASASSHTAVLPVTSLSMWKAKTGQEAQYARDTALRGFLLEHARALAQQSVARSEGGSQRQSRERLGGCPRHGWHFIRLQHPPSDGLVALRRTCGRYFFPVITATWFTKRRGF